MNRFFVYILLCSDGSYYIGSTDDLPARVARHNRAEGAAYTACRRPVKLVYSETALAEADAVRRERQIKHWTRAKKEALIAGDKERLKSLSKRRR